MVITRKDIWVGYGTEANWGGGMAGAEKAKTAFTNGNITATNNCRRIAFGAVHYTFESFKDFGSGATTTAATPTVNVVVDAGYKNPRLDAGLARVSTWLVAASGLINGGLGSTPTSYTIVGSNGLQDWQAFGCVIKRYMLTIEKKRPILEDVEFLHYDTTCGAVALTKVAFSTAAVKVAKDATILIDTAARQVKKLVVTVDLRYGAEGDGDIDLNAAFLREKPVLTGVEFTVEVTGRDATLAALLDGDLKSATTAGVTEHDISIAIPYAAATKTWAINDLVVQEGDDDETDADDGAKEYTWVLVPGSGFDQAVS